MRLERSRGDAVVKLRCSKLLRGQDDGDRAGWTKAIGFLVHKLLAGKDPQPLAQGCQLADAQLKASAGHGCNGSYLDIRDSCLNSCPQIGLKWPKENEGTGPELWGHEEQDRTTANPVPGPPSQGSRQSL